MTTTSDDPISPTPTGFFVAPSNGSTVAPNHAKTTENKGANAPLAGGSNCAAWGAVEPTIIRLRIRCGSPQKATDAQVVEAYRQTGSFHEAAAQLGMCHQTVWERLKRLGIKLALQPLSHAERQRIEEVYRRGVQRGDGQLDALAKELGRTKQFISRYAGTVGLTSSHRKFAKDLSAAMGDRVRNQWKTRPHPRGAMGCRHSDGAKMLFSWQSRARWESMTMDQKSSQIQKGMRTKLARHGCLVSPRQNVTWKQGWREIGGRRVYFRSRWEFNYAVYLQWLLEQKKIARWEHEPETFWFSGVKRGCVSYLPDYRVTNNDGSVEYHEVKGWMDAKSKTKLKRMKKYHPSVVLRVIGGNWFKRNGQLLCFLPGWEK